MENDAPIPPVDPADLNQFWTASRAIIREDHPGPNTAIEAGALGFDVKARGPEFEETFFYLVRRYWLILGLFARGLLRDYFAVIGTCDPSHSQPLDHACRIATAVAGPLIVGASKVECGSFLLDTGTKRNRRINIHLWVIASGGAVPIRARCRSGGGGRR